MNDVKRYIGVLAVSTFLFTMPHISLAKDDTELVEENQKLLDEIEQLNETIEQQEKRIDELEELVATYRENEEEIELEIDDEEEDEVYQIGKAFEVNGVTIRVEDAYYTDERNQLAGGSPDHVLMIEIYYENESGADYTPVFDFELYYDETIAKEHPIGDGILETISDGRNSTGTLAYEIMGSPEVIELEYKQMVNLFTHADPVIVDVTPEEDEEDENDEEVEEDK
ncbi:hypothetical protein [Aliicoccus persicus]|uniref:DUF4352 domain-containing protein n=1 Tax=Aliicoccus persicus TaxID=930138 RepID=A0A662Z2D4_9STAP|nr:hypothetical protein [Aliicoccus persicus]SEV79869.1 hypothetical protein SAMN05192557_0034 [Aliicoccus persicus]